MFMSPTSMGSLGSPTGTAMASEMELHWDPEVIRSELQTATIVLSLRGLKLSAKWASEQLLGLPTFKTNNNSGGGQQQQQQLKVTEADHAFITAVLQESDASVLYAKSLLELGEYMHAAAVLSLPNNIVTTMADPLPHLSSYGIYLRAYALFMAGERRKEEDYIELQRYVINMYF